VPDINVWHLTINTLKKTGEKFIEGALAFSGLITILTTLGIIWVLVSESFGFFQVVPIVDFLTAVERTGYDSYLSLEIFNDQFRAGSARTVAIDGKRSLIAAMDEVHRRTGGPSSVATLTARLIGSSITGQFGSGAEARSF